jgi:hypothetical protein
MWTMSTSDGMQYFTTSSRNDRVLGRVAYPPTAQLGEAGHSFVIALAATGY